MNKIAIQGHVTRGKDIIKILKNLGGKNVFNCEGYNVALFYYINSNGFITCNFSKGMPEGYEYYTLEDYEQQLLNTMKTKRNIQIDINTAKEWYNQGGTLKELALQAFSEKELKPLPSSWEEYCEMNRDIIGEYYFGDGNIIIPYTRKKNSFTFQNTKRAKQFVVLNQLLQLRDYYNQGWEPDWSNTRTRKFTIFTYDNKLFRDCSLQYSHIFSFETEKIRDTFFENFEKDLEFIKELI